MVIDFDLSTVLLFSIIYAGTVAYLRLKKKKAFVYLFFFTIFFIYLIEVLKYTEFPIYLIKSMSENYGQTVWKNMNLLPLITLGYQALQTSLLNILLLIPFGFGLPFISSFRMRQVVIRGVILSIILEALQLMSALMAGTTFRVVDINDVIFNTLGVAIGYILFIGFVRVFRLALERWNIPQNILLRYIYERSQV